MDQDSILSKLEEISQSILNLESLFDQKIRHSEHEENIVNQMHAELQQYKQDLYAQLVRPILLDIIVIRDSVLKTAQAYRQKPEGERSIPVDIFETYAVEVEDILAKNDVELYKSQQNNSFVPLEQRVIKKIETEDPEKDRTIAESFGYGYKYKGRVLSPENVAVFQYNKIDVTVNHEEEEKNG